MVSFLSGGGIESESGSNRGPVEGLDAKVGCVNRIFSLSSYRIFNLK